MSAEQLTEEISTVLQQREHRSDPLPIVQAGEPVLRRGAAEFVGQIPAPLLEDLIGAMVVTMRRAPGVGLAAPQIGIPLRLAVIEDRGNTSSPELMERMEREVMPLRIIVNPRYVALGSEQRAFWEGCLSVEGWQSVVLRARRIRLTGADEHGQGIDEELTGWPARIVQHETDHLDGVLCHDLGIDRSLASNRAVAMKWHGDVAAAAKGLGFELPQ